MQCSDSGQQCRVAEIRGNPCGMLGGRGRRGRVAERASYASETLQHQPFTATVVEQAPYLER